MALSELQRAEVAKRLPEFASARVPAHARNQIRIDFRIDGNAVVLFEERPSFRRPADWDASDIAKFRWIASRKVWQLFCKFRDGRWHGYEPLLESRAFARLLDEVAVDPTGIFWG